MEIQPEKNSIQDTIICLKEEPQQGSSQASFGKYAEWMQPPAQGGFLAPERVKAAPSASTAFLPWPSFRTQCSKPPLPKSFDGAFSEPARLNQADADAFTEMAKGQLHLLQRYRKDFNLQEEYPSAEKALQQVANGSEDIFESLIELGWFAARLEVAAPNHLKIGKAKELYQELIRWPFLDPQVTSRNPTDLLERLIEGEASLSNLDKWIYVLLRQGAVPSEKAIDRMHQYLQNTPAFSSSTDGEWKAIFTKLCDEAEHPSNVCDAWEQMALEILDKIRGGTINPYEVEEKCRRPLKFLAKHRPKALEKAAKEAVEIIVQGLLNQTAYTPEPCFGSRPKELDRSDPLYDILKNASDKFPHVDQFGLRWSDSHSSARKLLKQIAHSGPEGQSILEAASHSVAAQLASDDANRAFHILHLTENTDRGFMIGIKTGGEKDICLRALFPFIKKKEEHLLYAAVTGDAKTVQSILDANPECDVDAVTCDDQTPFEYACQAGNTDIARMLLARGARFKQLPGSPTVLHKAGSGDMARWLLSQEFAKKRLETRSLLDEGNCFRKGTCFKEPEYLTPLGSAVARSLYQQSLGKDPQGLKDAILAFLEEGASPLTTLSNGRTLLEFVYAYGRQPPDSFQGNPENVQALFRLLCGYAPKLPDTLLDSLKRSYAHGDLHLRPILQKFAPEALEEMDNSFPSDTGQAELQMRAFQLTLDLKKALRLHWLDPEQIDLRLLSESMEVLNASGNTHWKRDLLTVYERAGAAQPLWREILEIERNLRAEPRTLSAMEEMRLYKFNGLWSRDETASRAQSFNEIDLQAYRAEFPEMRSRIIRASQEGRDLPKGQWVMHGTKSFTASMARQTDNSLWASGELIAQGLAPLGGEHCQAQGGWNVKYISFTPMDPNWEQEPVRWFQGVATPTRATVAISYAERRANFTGAGTRELVFSRNRAWKILKGIKGIWEQTSSPLWYDLHLAALRLRQMDPDFFHGNKHARIESWALKIASSDLHNFKDKEGANKLLEILRNPPPRQIHLDPALVEASYPVVFAGFGLQTKVLMRKQTAGSPDEVGVETRARLGMEIPYAFTSKDHIPHLEGVMEGSGVKVLDIDVLRYVEMRRMAMGSEALHLQAKKAPIAQLLAWHFHHRVLPFYARPFPPEPTYRNKQGKRSAVPRPLYHGQDSYTEYLAKVESGEISPRVIHGPRHAAGAALLACWLYGRTRSTGPLLPLVLAAGMHDAARQDEGKDWWDAESAKLFREIFGEEIGDAELYVHAMEHKDSPGSADTLIRQIIHDADCLEIVRIFLNRYEELFDPSRLALFDSPRGLADRPELKQAIEFIRFTENPVYKRYMEEYSTDYLGDLYRTLLYVHQQRGGFELFVNDLKPVLKGLEGALSPGLKEVVSANL